MSKIRFMYSYEKAIPFKKRKEVKAFLKEMFTCEKKELAEVNYIFCSDAYLLEINREYLNHDYFTDIITFDLSESKETVGEVYISIDRVRENAKEHGSSFYSELLRVVFHGALHLIGYKDKKKSEITEMRQKEEYYLRLFGKQ